MCCCKMKVSDVKHRTSYSYQLKNPESGPIFEVPFHEYFA